MAPLVPPVPPVSLVPLTQAQSVPLVPLGRLVQQVLLAKVALVLLVLPDLKDLKDRMDILTMDNNFLLVLLAQLALAFKDLQVQREAMQIPAPAMKCIPILILTLTSGLLTHQQLINLVHILARLISRPIARLALLLLEAVAIA
jgi:hypothetical protein